MAKSRRKPSEKQRDKYALQIAKVLKAKGVLSKQTKLHGGKFISRNVLKKTQELRHLAFSIHGEKPQYTTIKVSKAQAKAAKDEGYQVVQGTRVVVPNEHDFIKRVKAGHLSGIRPVKGGHMSEITLPLGADNSSSIMRWLEGGDLEELKLPHEMFAFTFHGSTSRRAFNSAEQMRRYLEHYNQSDLMKALKIFRLHPEDQIKLIDEERVSIKRGPRGRQDARGDYRRTSYAERMERLSRVNPAKYRRIQEQEKVKWARRKERMASSGKENEYMDAARKRALAHYHANKKTKK